MPYEDFQPGDLVEAERMNSMQDKIKTDIQNQVSSAKDEIRETGVERADNADQFDNRTPKEWTDELDERYAPKVHDHEGQTVYRRYFKRMRADQTVVLEHELDRLPLVDVYQLLPVPPEDAEGNAQESVFYLYYHHEERDRDVLFTEDRGMVRWPWGTPLEQMLYEYGVEWEDDDSLGDVVNDFLDAFFKPPVVDHMEHRTSVWINEHRESIISDLKRRDEWPDIRWVVRPHKLVVGLPMSTVSDAGDGTGDGITITPAVNVAHLSYDTLAVMAAGNLGGDENGNAIDLMILLRR